MICKSEVLTQASGSVGGTVYGRNHGRITRRARTVPTDPHSTHQRAHRRRIATLASAWTDDATDGNRKTWAAYSLGVPVPDKLGDDQLISGRAMFIACNHARLQAGLAIVLAGPAHNGRDSFNDPNFTSPGGAANFLWLPDQSDEWANEDFGALNIQTSRVLSPAIGYFNGPWRYLASMFGALGAPPLFFFSPVNAFGQTSLRTVAGQKIAFRYTSLRADGRISASREILHTFT